MESRIHIVETVLHLQQPPKTYKNPKAQWQTWVFCCMGGGHAFKCHLCLTHCMNDVTAIASGKLRAAAHRCEHLPISFPVEKSRKSRQPLQVCAVRQWMAVVPQVCHPGTRAPLSYTSANPV